MGNTASTASSRRTSLPTEEAVTDADLQAYYEEVSMGAEFSEHYQQTLHQYLSQRYANRYANRQRSYQQQAQPQANETGFFKNYRTNSSLASRETISLILKQQKLREVPKEVFKQTDITALDLSSNGKKRVQLSGVVD